MSEWLVEEGLGGLVDKFRANNIDGIELLNLSKETLASELHIGEEDKHHILISECSATSSVSRSLLALVRVNSEHGRDEGFFVPVYMDKTQHIELK